MQNDDEFFPKKRVRLRYNVTERTIDRWAQIGVLPPPETINGRKYWRRSALERNERDGMSRRPGTAA